MDRIRIASRLLPILTALTLLLCGCVAPAPAAVVESAEIVDAVEYANGDYRGVYNDGGIEQFSVAFTLADNRFTSVTLHAVNYRDGDYLNADATRIQTQVASQYKEAADYLVGKPVSAVADLMDPSLVTTDRDAVTAATLRMGKLISALRDGLRRGAFTPSSTVALPLPQSLADGVYNGAYFENARERVTVSFTLRSALPEDVVITLFDEASSVGMRAESCEKLLEGEPLSALTALYEQDDLGAGVSGGMVVSAFMDALGRGVFEPVSTTVFPSLGGYESGVYRGFFYADGTERVSIQFELINDAFGEVVFRKLVCDEGDCLSEEAPESLRTMAAQFRALAAYLSGKEVSRVYDLFSPASIVTDATDSPAAALPVNQMIAAIMDGLGRGVYRPLEID